MWWDSSTPPQSHQGAGRGSARLFGSDPPPWLVVLCPRLPAQGEHPTGLPCQERLHLLAPACQGVLLLHVVAVPIVDRRDAALDVVQDLRDHQARNAHRGSWWEAAVRRRSCRPEGHPGERTYPGAYCLHLGEGLSRVVRAWEHIPQAPAPCSEGRSGGPNNGGGERHPMCQLVFGHSGRDGPPEAVNIFPAHEADFTHPLGGQDL